MTQLAMYQSSQKPDQAPQEVIILEKFEDSMFGDQWLIRWGESCLAGIVRASELTLVNEWPQEYYDRMARLEELLAEIFKQ